MRVPLGGRNLMCVGLFEVSTAVAAVTTAMGNRGNIEKSVNIFKQNGEDKKKCILCARFFFLQSWKLQELNISPKTIQNAKSVKCIGGIICACVCERIVPYHCGLMQTIRCHLHTI